jgi:hypothetical protein
MRICQYGCVANAKFLAALVTGNIAGSPVNKGFRQNTVSPLLVLCGYLQHIRRD